MAPRSAFAKAREGQVRQLLGRLIQATLQDIATGENLDAALEWCVQHIKDHQAPDTNPAAVQADFQSLLDKLRVHSQLEAADYLEEQHAAFMRCRLGEGEGRCAEAPEALLRALLLLARQPAHVSVRVVRSLRSVFESRRAQALQRRRREAEALHDRKALLEQELQEVADRSMLGWDEAWAQPDLVPESLILPPEEQRLPARSPSSPSQPPSDSEEGLSSSLTGSSSDSEEEGHEEELESQSTAPPSICTAPPQHELPQGLLPRPAWLDQVDAGLLSPATAIVVSEQAAQQMALQLLLGVPGELNTVTHEGDLRWRLLRVEHLSLQSLHSLLRPLAELGSRLQQLRQFTSLLERVAPPLSDRKLCGEIASLLKERQLSLRALAKLGGDTKRRSPGQGDVGRLPAPHLFGRCWSSMGSALSELLRDFESKVRGMDAELQQATTAARVDKVCPLLCSLDRWAGPHKRAAATTHQVLDQVLRRICERCDAEAVEDWAATAAEELIQHLARVLRGVGVAGGGEPWLGRLWLGAVQPVLDAMDQWATSGELHDPLGELRCRGAEPAPLFPQSAFAAGRHLQLLRHWAEGSPLAAAAAEGYPLAATAELGLREAAAQRASAVMAEAADEPPRRFVPLETAFGAHVLAPTQRVAEAIQRPVVTSFMQDRHVGLLRHWAAIRLVAFLERSDAVEPLVQRVLHHLRRRSFEQASCDTVAIELNAALAEGIEVDSCRSRVPQPQPSPLPPWVVPLGLCERHMTVAVAPQEVRSAASRQKSQDPCDALVRLRLRYEAPSPLDEVISEDALEVYASVLVLLLRVRYAEALLLEVGRGLLSPLLGGLRDPQLRRCPGWWRSDPRGRLLSDFAHRCDLFRAEVLHFVRCLDRYLRDEAIAAGSKALAEHFRTIGGGSAPPESPRRLRQGSTAVHSMDESAGQDSSADVLERVRCAHWAYLTQLMQDCFLAPELRAVRADLEYSTGVASELRELLASVALPPHSGGAGGAGAGDAQQALTRAAAELSRMQREFRKSTSYLLQVLTFSSGLRGGTQRSSGGLCLQANFNDFYGGSGVAEPLA